MNSARNSGSFRIANIEVSVVRTGSQVAGVRTISCPDDSARLFMETAPKTDEREHFRIALLDIRHAVKALYTVSIGTLSASLVHPREVFRPAILAGAAAIVVTHNHPSGDPEPSAEETSRSRGAWPAPARCSESSCSTTSSLAMAAT